MSVNEFGKSAALKLYNRKAVRLRVVLDANWWARGTQSLQHVVHGLIETWSAMYPQDELIIVVRHKDLDKIGEVPPNVRAVSTRLWPQALAAAFAVPWKARQNRADAMLAHNFSPVFGKNRAVMIQDLTFITNPEWFSKKELLYYRWMTRLAQRAHVVFSTTIVEGKRISRFTKASHVVPVGLGISDDVLVGEAQPMSGLNPEAFMLTVGRLNVRKNLIGILEGARHSRLLSPEFPLVIVGAQEGRLEDFPEWVYREERLGHIVFTGFVSMAQLRWLIRNCAFYVSLSLDEGFGLPPVEARLAGATVLVSDRAVFRENLGNEATYVDPTSPRAVGEAMARLAGPPNASIAPESSFTDRHTWRRTVSMLRNEILELVSDSS